MLSVCMIVRNEAEILRKALESVKGADDSIDEEVSAEYNGTMNKSPWNKGIKGLHLSPESEFKKGMTPWNKGKKLSKKHVENLRLSHIGPKPWLRGVKRENMMGEKHPNWKGDDVGYQALHRWVNRNFGAPNKCEMDGCVYPRMNMRNKLMERPARYEWANIGDNYSRNREDWMMMCPSCHRKYDNGQRRG